MFLKNKSPIKCFFYPKQKKEQFAVLLGKASKAGILSLTTSKITVVLFYQF